VVGRSFSASGAADFKWDEILPRFIGRSSEGAWACDRLLFVDVKVGAGCESGRLEDMLKMDAIAPVCGLGF
jgi:hypothetical protein